MAEQGTGIDWNKLAAQPVSPTAGIDWSKVPAVGQGQSTPEDKLIHSQSAVGTLKADEHPIEHRIDDIVNDVKFGPGVNDDRLPERAMRAVGFHGTETGGTGSAGAAMPISGAVEGIPELIHAASRVPQVHSVNNAESVAHEAIGGGMKTLAGVAPFVAPEAMPLVVPSVATGGTAGTVASGAAKFAGASPETQQLVGDAASIAVPAFAGPVGRGLQEHAPTIGKTAGYGTAAATMAHSLLGKGRTINPLDLLFASKPATAGATGVASGVGKMIEASDPFQDLGLHSSPRGAQAEPEILPPEPKQLPRGPIQMPAPPDESGPRLVNAQPAVVRDTNTGRMRKQFLPTETTGKAVYPEKLINTDSNPESQAPPNSPQKEFGLDSSALKSSPKENGNGKASTQGEQFNNNLDSIIQNYQEVLKTDPNNEQAQAALKIFSGLKDEISQPGYQNPFIDLNAPANGSLSSGPKEEVPNPNGTATETKPGDIVKTEIPVKKLENGGKVDKNREKNQPYESVPKRPPEFGVGSQKEK